MTLTSQPHPAETATGGTPIQPLARQLAAAGLGVQVSGHRDTMDAITGFYATRVFGPDRAALLKAVIPVTTAAVTARAAARSKALRKKLAKIDVAETALITELETPADPGNPAAQALRNRIRARFTELYAERASLETDLAALDATTSEPADDPPCSTNYPSSGTSSPTPRTH